MHKKGKRNNKRKRIKERLVLNPLGRETIANKTVISKRPKLNSCSSGPSNQRAEWRQQMVSTMSQLVKPCTLKSLISKRKTTLHKMTKVMMYSMTSQVKFYISQIDLN